MKLTAKLLVAALLTGLGMAMVPVPDAVAGSVTQTKDDCITAWAILAPNTEQVRGAVRRIIDGNDRLEDEGYEPKVSEKFELMVFDLVDGRGEAIVAHCGHGGTCNFLAQEVNKQYPTTSPVVVCTHDPPNSLENGRAF